MNDPITVAEQKTRLDLFIDTQIKANPIEAKIARRVFRTLKAAGNPVTSVWDGVEENPVKSEREMLVQVFNLDSATLYTQSGSFVYLVLGNEWDMISDYGVSLEDTLNPVVEWTIDQD